MRHLGLDDGFRASDPWGSLPSCFRGFFMNIIGYIFPVGKEGTSKAASGTGQPPGQEERGLFLSPEVSLPCPWSTGPSLPCVRPGAALELPSPAHSRPGASQ